jgi:HSP20 family protein
MFTLMRRMPLNELAALDCGLENMIASFVNAGNLKMQKSSQPDSPFETEVFNKDNQLFYRVALPGVDQKDIELSVENNVLRIKAERKQPFQVDEKDWHAKSFLYGRFEHSYVLPKDANPEEVAADFKNGVLEIRVPLENAAISRKIEVKSLESAVV